MQFNKLFNTIHVILTMIAMVTCGIDDITTNELTEYIVSIYSTQSVIRR